MSLSRISAILLAALAPLVAVDAPKLVPVFGERTFERPIGLWQPGDGKRIYVLQQRGTVFVFTPENPAGGVFLQRQVLTKGNEEGLLSIAFHPGFADNGTFFLYYSAADPRRTVLSRMRIAAGDPAKADPGSEQVLLTADQPFDNHNGGTLLFGPDGKLYLGLGDGGSAGDPQDNGQKTATFLGKILRLDVDAAADAGLAYAVPKDNPFVGRDGWKPEIWALGLRNPWRMSFDRETGELWAGDVGQNYWEEIDIITRGGNYGWKNHEAKHPFEKRPPIPGAIDPVFEYPRGEGQSITGGYVYRGKRLKDLVGHYVYGDFNTGRIWALRRQGDQVQNRLLIQLAKGQQVASFAEDAAGELYLCTFEGPNGNQGRVYRFEP